MSNFFAGGALKGLGGLLMGKSGLGPSINLFNTLSLQQQQMLNNAIGLGQLGINKVGASFDKARAGVNQAKGAATTEARDAGVQAAGAASNNAVSRGITNTSTIPAVSRGIGSDLAKHIAWLDSQASSALGGLDVAEGQSLNAGYNNLGQLYTQFGQNNAALASPIMAQLAQGQPGILGPLATFGGLAMASDPRLKKEIEFEGMAYTHGGVAFPTYSFEYKDPNLPGRYLGVMSTDVKQLPGVVTRAKSGFDTVDYLRLYELTGFQFKKLEERVTA